MIVNTSWNIFNFNGGNIHSKPSFDIRIQDTTLTEHILIILLLLRYLRSAPWKADENVISNISAKIGDYGLRNKRQDNLLKDGFRSYVLSD